MAKHSSIDLAQIASNDEIKNYLEMTIVQSARESLFKQFRAHFWLQRTIEAIVIAVVAFLGLTSYWDLSEKVDGLDASVRVTISKKIDAEFKERKEQVAEADARLAALEFASATRADSLRALDARILLQQQRLEAVARATDAFFETPAWKEADFVKTALNLFQDVEKAGSVGSLVDKVTELKDDFERHLPRTFFADVKPNQSAGNSTTTTLASLKIRPQGRPIAFYLSPTAQNEDGTGSRFANNYGGGSGFVVSLWRLDPKGDTSIGMVDFMGTYGQPNKVWGGSMFMGVDSPPESQQSEQYELRVKAISGTVTLTSARLVAFELPDVEAAITQTPK